MEDMELLGEYATRNSDQAFATIVSRHINLVYSVALRHAGNPHQAEEITQAVFIVLAKKAGSLRKGTVLSGWLFHAARMTASNFLRTELRRARREQEAYMQSTLSETATDQDWKQIAPLLDAAMAGLGEKDRNAIVLRYVEGKDLKEVGVALGASEDAAKKRVSRAVEKLRGFFSKRGVMLSSAALAGAISANAMQAAPAGLAATVATAAVKGAVATASTLTLVKGTLKLMAWTKVKIAVGLSMAAVVAYQWHQNLEQTKRISGLQEELQEAKRHAESEQTMVDKLKQEKLAMVDEKLATEKSAARLLAHQRAAFDKTAAKNAAVLAAAGSNSTGNALGRILDDPAMKEFMRQAQMRTLKTQYAPLIKTLNMSPDAADKFFQLLADNAAQKMDIGMAVMKGDMDPATVKQSQAEAKNNLAGQLQSLLGPDGYAQYDEFSQDLPAKASLGLLKAEMADNPLNDDQSARLLQLLKTGPKAGDIDYSQTGAMEQLLQQEAENNQRILQQAADFLTPDQLASVGAFQTNMINMQKVGMSMKNKFLNGK